MVLIPLSTIQKKAKPSWDIYMQGWKSNNRKEGIRRIVMGWVQAQLCWPERWTQIPQIPLGTVKQRGKWEPFVSIALAFSGADRVGSLVPAVFSGSVEREAWSLLCSLVTGEGLIGPAVFSGQWSGKPGPCCVLWSLVWDIWSLLSSLGMLE